MHFHITMSLIRIKDIKRRGWEDGRKFGRGVLRVTTLGTTSVQSHGSRTSTGSIRSLLGNSQDRDLPIHVHAASPPSAPRIAAPKTLKKEPDKTKACDHVIGGSGSISRATTLPNTFESQCFWRWLHTLTTTVISQHTSKTRLPTPSLTRGQDWMLPMLARNCSWNGWGLS